MRLKHEELEDIVKNYKFLVDTSALMWPNSEKFFIETLLPLLKKHNKKLNVPTTVIKELKKHEMNHEKRKDAERAKYIIYKYEQEFALAKRGEETDEIPDQVFQMILTKFKTHYNLAFITNDKKLAEDLCTIYNTESVKTKRSMVVISITIDGGARIIAKNDYPHIFRAVPPAWASKTIQELDFDIGDTSGYGDQTTVALIPEKGDVVHTNYGNPYTLADEIGGGGEGRVYLTNDPSHVAKIFKKDKINTKLYEKLRIMVKNKDKILTSTENFSIAWPQELLFNSKGEFVGYLMPRARGEPLRKIIFLKKNLEEKWPHFKRVHLVRTAINILEALSYLHSFKVLMGDINANNILVDENCHVSLIDVDSYQVGPYKCEVGRPELTHPDRLGMRYEEFMREPKDELFGIGILVFMIFLGKHPFSHQGGEGNIIDNIKSRIFPYRVSTVKETSYENAPIGPWRFIWSHLPLYLKEDLHNILKGYVEPKTYEELIRIIQDLIYKLKRYEKEILAGKRSNELFPRYFYIPDHIPKVKLNCSRCGKYFEIPYEYYESIKHRKDILCPYCFKIRQLTSSPAIQPAKTAVAVTSNKPTAVTKLSAISSAIKRYISETTTRTSMSSYPHKNRLSIVESWAKTIHEILSNQTFQKVVIYFALGLFALWILASMADVIITGILVGAVLILLVKLMEEYSKQNIKKRKKRRW